jgi:hypothetical protein
MICVRIGASDRCLKVPIFGRESASDTKRLGLGTRRDFSTSVVGSAPSIEDERLALTLVVETARPAFGDVA